MLRDEELITVALLRRFKAESEFEGGKGQFYGIVSKSNGDLVVHHPGSPPLAAEQVMWAADILRRLNKELHHDGAWVVVFTDPAPVGLPEAMFSHGSHIEYGRYALLWLDQDGDAQFAIEWVRNESELLDWADVLIAGIETVLGKAEAAWELWHTHMREVIDPMEGQTFARAKGEIPSSTRH